MTELYTSGGFVLPPDKKDGGGLLPSEARVTGQAVAMPLSKRFDIYVIDTGWNVEVSKIVEEYLPLMNKILHQQAIYLLNPSQSLTLCRRFPVLIGNSPVIVVLDHDMVREHREGGVGFRVNLGMLKNAHLADDLMRWVVQILLYRATSRDIVETVHKTMYKEGVMGAVEIMFETLHMQTAAGKH